MAKSAVSGISPKNWCANPYRDAKAAILDIDLTVQSQPEDASNILGTAWTGLTLLAACTGIPDPRWLPVMGRFHKLSAGERSRVRAAVEMRMRAVERAAA